MKSFSLIVLLCLVCIFAFSSGNNSSSSSSSSSSNEDHYIYAFQVNTEIGSNQYFIVINPSENTIIKNVSINVPNEYIINGILGINQITNSILLYSISDLYSTGAILSLDLNSNEISLYGSNLLNYKGKYANQPYVYSGDVVYMAMESNGVSGVLGLAKYDFTEQSSKFYNIETSGFSSEILPLIAYDRSNQLMYYTYSPLSSPSETNLLVIDPESPSIEKQFSSIKGLENSIKNSMLLTSPNGTLFLIQSNQNNNGMDMCQFDLSNNICNNVFSAQMIKDFNQNIQFNPFQLTLDNSALIVSNFVKADNKGNTMLTEVSIIDLDSLFPIASFTLNNYFNSSNPSIQYFFSYL
ncbi:hypothetical protein ACTFIR_012153 [Dictyostelium discoideum]